jgi:hypothetical protein
LCSTAQASVRPLALVTARAEIVAPLIWSKRPPSFFTRHLLWGTLSKPRLLNWVIHGRVLLRSFFGSM